MSTSEHRAAIMKEFTATEFCRAFLSQLVLNGDRVIQPKNPADRRGFRQIVSVLDRAASAAELEDRSWYKQVVRLRNFIQAGNNGAFDGFETLLRDLQTSSVLHPNPKYEFLTIEVSPSFAEAIIARLEERQRRLVRDATEAFGRAKKNEPASLQAS